MKNERTVNTVKLDIWCLLRLIGLKKRCILSLAWFAVDLPYRKRIYWNI